MAVYVYFVFVLVPLVCCLGESLVRFDLVFGFQRSNFLVSFESNAPVVFFTCLVLGACEITLGFMGNTSVLSGICGWTDFLVSGFS